ncbi:MAG: ABC transporter permease [Pyrinomonadaceae bacterium]|nr:ABC transporter permease [Pyrinomonadaceae bacterium]
MKTLLQDLRYGLRILLSKPGFTAVAVLTLALGIGANTMIFSVINALLLRPLPFREANRIVSLAETAQNGDITPVSPANFSDWRAQSQSFDNLAAFEFDSFNLTETGQPENISGAWTSAELFRVLGVEAALGRTLSFDDEKPDAERVVVLTDGLWQRRFGADQNIIGRQVKLDGIDRPQAGGVYTVVGVLPRNFWFVSGQFDVWIPHRLTPEQVVNRAARSQQVVARLKPGVPIAQAQAEMQSIARRLAEEYPKTNEQRGVSVVSLQERLMGEFGAAMFILLGAVCFVLLIACANVASLLLARAAARQKEIAIRAALGANRFQIVRQLLTESVLLATLGGLAGLLLAVWSLDLVVALIPSEAQTFIPGGAQTIKADWRVLCFTLGVSTITGIVFGLAPALAATKPNLNELLKEGGSSMQGPRRQRLRSVLVVAEVALSLMLLISAGLMMKSLLQLHRAELGFNADRVLKVEIPLSPGKYPESRQKTAFYDQLLERVAALPGVESVSISNNYPLRLPNRTLFVIEGRPTPSRDNMPAASDIAISPDYFETLGVSFRVGRPFNGRDAAGSQPVGIINETAARRFWPDENPVGKRLRLGNLESQSPWLEIVGVVPDVRQELNGEPIFPALYRPFAQSPLNFAWLLVRTASEPTNSVAAIRHEIETIDKDQPISGIAPMPQVIAEAAWGNRLVTFLLGVFGVVALALAAMGIYGVIAYSVVQRTYEIGVRIALGAQPRDALRLIVKQGLLLTLIGTGIGLGGALAFTQVLSSLLLGVSATDSTTFIVVPLLLIGVALLACYIPARRAAKVDPMVALRYE